MSVLVVGAGISGAVIARLIAQNTDKQVLVIDKRDTLAGNCFDYKDNKTGITVHKYGAHIFHTNNEKVWNFISGFAEFYPYIHKLKVSINNKFITFPFNFDSIEETFPKEKAEILIKKLVTKYGENTEVPILELLENDDSDLKELANYVYDNVFKNYTTKQWGMNPKQIDKTVMSRVPIRLNHDNRYFTDKYQGNPCGGYTKLIEKLLDHKKITIQLNTDYKKINKDFEQIFYTGAIDEFFDYKYGHLPYRSLNFNIKTKDIEYYQPCSVINYPNDYNYTRTIEHKYFLNENSDKTIISYEYPTPFIEGKNDRYYPIISSQNRELYEKYLLESKKINNLYFLGRLGDYKYYNMDSAIERAINLYEEIYEK